MSVEEMISILDADYIGHCPDFKKEVYKALRKVEVDSETFAALVKSHNAQLDYIRKLEAVVEATDALLNDARATMWEEAAIQDLQHALNALHES